MKANYTFGLFAMILLGGTARAEVPRMTAADLESHASHIVDGKVRAVYSTTEKSRNWEDTVSVAEIYVVDVEKGAGLCIGDVVYAHYWNKDWIGKGEPEPYSSGHVGVTKGQWVRVFLVRRDGKFHVLLPNGFAVSNPKESAEVSPTTKLQGTWSFAYYEEKGVIQKPGTRQFVVTGNRLDFRVGGKTKVETKIEVNDETFDQEFQDGQVYRSVFRRVGDLLVVCGNRDKEPPTEFSAHAESGGEFFIVLRKQ